MHQPHTHTSDARRRRWFRRLAAAAVLAAVAPGCTRKFFREKADKDVTGVITQKNQFPDWKVENWHVYPDPRSRFAAPYNQDHPPYPADDYAAYMLSPNPQTPKKKWGAGRVEGDGYLKVLAGYDLENSALDQLREQARQAKDGQPNGDTPAAPEKVPAPKADAPAGPVPQPSPVVPPAAPPLPNIPEAPAARRNDPASMGVGSDGLVQASVRAALSGVDSDGAPTGPVRRSVEVAPMPRAFEADRPPPQAGPDEASRSHPEPDTGGVKQAAPRPFPVAGALRGRRKPLPELPPPLALVAEVAPPPRPLADATVVAAAFTQPPPAAQPAVPKNLPVPGVPGATDPKAVGPEPAPAPKDLPGYLTQPTDGPVDPNYLQALASEEVGYKLRLDQAVVFGLFNSREFQDRREDLYLTALPVTLQRFSFAAQAFFTEEAVREITGSERPEGRGNRWRFNTAGGISRLFPTGAELLLQFANQLVIEITGDAPTISVSDLTFRAVQPLLAGGGYAVNLEPLTQAERTLLYAIRSYARFRRIFYVAIAAGGGYTNNPYGLQGLAANLGRGVGNNLTAPSAGFMPLLNRSAIIANQQKNITFLEDLLKLYEAFREGGQQSDLQVGQVEQQLLNARQDLLGSSNASIGGGGGVSGSGIRGYQDAVDSFKLQLGLPMTVGLDLEATPLAPVRQQLARFEGVYAQVRDVEQAARRFDPADPVEQFRPRWRNLLTESALVRGTAFATDIRTRWAAWERLSADDLNRRLGELQDERRRLLDRKTDLEVKGDRVPEADARRLALLNADIDLGRFEQAVRLYESRPWARLTGPAAAASQAGAFRDVFNAFYLLILEGRNERLADIRGLWPELPPLCVNGVDLTKVPLDEAYTLGIQTALVQRLDLMNSRAQVVDAYRQIAVTANALQGVLDVEYNLVTNTPPDGANPLAFAGSRTRHQFIVRGELPLVRRAERNAYRAALIGYQRQRRAVQAFEDNIANDVRGDIRELRAIAEQFRIQQRLIELGYSTVDNAQAILLAPPAPGTQSDAGSAAALTQQVLSAQSSLLNAQNDLYTIWVSYLISRMQLALDLEQMQLDERGLWIDEFTPSPLGDGRQPDPGPAAGPAERERVPAPRPAEKP